MKSKWFKVTVNAPELISYYSNTFHCFKDKFNLVYDSINLNESEEQMIKFRQEQDTRYVFFGGKAFRDVDTFVKIVKLLPTVHFKAVVLKDMIVPGMKGLKNLEIFQDVDKEEFYKILCGASVCCIPLNATIPCGLYVMQHAILMGIPIVSTNTPSMRTIVPNDNYGYLLERGDACGMAQRVKELLANKEIAKNIAKAAYSNMYKFTPKAVATQLCELLTTINNKG